MRKSVSLFLGVLSLGTVLSGGSQVSKHEQLIDESLSKSALIESKIPFHLHLEIHPGKVLFPGHQASPNMAGSMDVFWVTPLRYKLVLTSSDFTQTKIVDGNLVEEHDEGEFYPRWLDNFVQAFMNPLPKANVLKGMELRMTGGGTMNLPGRAPLTMPRCLNKEDRPDGITDETSVARVCVDATQTLIESGLDFTRYVSFSDYSKFGDQEIPRKWSDDIPENIYVDGDVTRLEKLSKQEIENIRVTKPTPIKDQIRTVFLPRQKLTELFEPIPDYEWPPVKIGKSDGYMIVYVRTDREGKIRESYWDNSDNYGLQDAGVQYALGAQLKPTAIDGGSVQVEGPLVLHFASKPDASVSSERQ